ncbi:NAD(P)/FAD-dependent oxidoreductase [Leptothoe spongobia]|uniref:Tryptophan 7-halogenase n=1 Tax=Leptothoe spongobia TAU-MAC 1115 TaxID=1967444 RepID=A0A947DJD0_9CYAN|nr:tryptophan 7-halogenase [Leptothoe spongobia]MBT9318008.1 tryptophan 7-halogenase [Leptothoe spongobia TAU-MAC 1115]
MLYDAAIIGAGPAGCAAAITLARKNLHVLLIEASEFPRHRPGESLHPGVEPIFEALGIASEVNAKGFIRHAGHRIIWDQEILGRTEKFGKDEHHEWYGYQAWRPELDQILLQQAKACGVTVWQPCRVRDIHLEGAELVGLNTERGAVRARYFLDASGRSQWLLHKLGLHSLKYSPKFRVRYGYVTCPAAVDAFETPLMHRDPDGWTWIARVRENRCAWVRMRFDGVDPGSVWRPPLLENFEAIGSSKGEDMTWRIGEKLAGENWFLMGDAAAVLDPASSHGVLRALMSGMQVAHMIVVSVQGKISNTLAAKFYSQWLQDWFHSDVSRLRELYWDGNVKPQQQETTVLASTV